MPLRSSGVCFYSIVLATSDDGSNWQRANDGEPVLHLGPMGSYGEEQAATPSTLPGELRDPSFP